MNYEKAVGVGGIGTGIFFRLTDNAALGREESRGGILTDYKDYCKLHIIFSATARLLGGKAEVCAIGKVGKDAAGRRLLCEMRNAGIRCDGVRATGRAPTTFSVCFQFPDGKGGNITAVNGAASLADEYFIGKYLEKTGIDGKTIALAAPEISLPARLFFIERCHAAGAFVAAAFSSEEMASGEVRGALPQIDLLSANIDEAAALAGSEEDAVEKCCRIADAAGGNTRLCITDGAKGAFVYERGVLQHFCSIPSRVVSTAGAGDAFLGGVLAGIALGLPLLKEGEDAAFGRTLPCTATELGTVAAHFAVESASTIPEEFSAEKAAAFLKENGFQASPIVEKLL